ncbi:MAG: PQQ-binding-like beta-propeller repeat protein [Deltaproteobacteria bacterium]|nr:PQQ-binding-like beta-propeller repeat protein [Deltaproteobacteria bacterium]
MTMAAVAAGVLALGGTALAGDWPMWGRTPARNMTSPETGLPTRLNPGRLDASADEVDVKGVPGVKWLAKLGSQSFGNPVVAGGRVYVGTNNGGERDPKYQGDFSMVMAFDEKSGRYLWQLATPKLGAGKVSDWEYLGICSSPAVERDRVFVVTNRAQVVALDPQGMRNGNAGPFKDEAQYSAPEGKPPIPTGKGDGDLLWTYDMRQELDVFPHNITSSSVLILGDRLYVTTSNGVDWSHKNLPSPMAPALVVLDKKTGALLGEESVGISARTMHSNWSSPTLAKAGGKDIVVFGAGDGFVYGFDPVPKEDAEGLSVLTELWRFDANPKGYRMRDGEPVPYARRDGPSELIATPVFHDGLVYAAIGQDPEHGTGAGALSCLDPSKRGDITQTGKVWQFEGIGRSISTVAVADGLVYAADLAGKVYCLDAKTGELYWQHDTRSHIWGSPMVADGKVYIGNESGVMTVFEAGKKLNVLSVSQFHSPIYATPVAANGVLYVSTHSHLYAFVKTRESEAAPADKRGETP